MTISVGGMYKRMFILYCDTYKKAIFWSAKCACSVVKYAVYNIIEKRGLKSVHIKDSYGSYNKNKLDTYEKIIVCRNPYSRIVSAYLDKIDNFKNYKHFNDFIFNFDIYKNHHTAPQFSEAYSSITNNKYNILFDKIYYLDNFNLQLFLQEVFSYTAHDEELHKINKNQLIYSEFSVNRADLIDFQELKTIKETRQTPSWASFYQDQSVIDQVKKIYEVDFENLLKLSIEINSPNLKKNTNYGR